MKNSHDENTKRVTKNTAFLYVRMLIGMVVSLYTSRVILRALGVEDFGILGVVGSLVAMFSLVSGSIQASITRYLTFELGSANEQRLRETFSAAFFIQLILAAIIFVLGESIGLYILNYILNIPADRIFAANFVFQFSLISFILGLMLMPYNACINAHEKMNVFAYFGLLDIGLKLAIVLFVAYAPFAFDKLIVYSMLLVALGIVIQTITVIYCRRHFPETKVTPAIHKGIMRSMFGFAGWNFIGASSALLRDTGGNILLNYFFGPVVNAARSIGGSVSAAAAGFSGNFFAAVSPQITKSYASGDHQYMFSLINRSAKFSFMMMLFFALPILFNTDFILNLWLGEVPPYSRIFVILILIFTLSESISSPLITVQLATGKIKKYQIVVGGLQSLNFPFCLLFLWLGAPPQSVFYTAIFLSICCLCARLFFLRYMIGLSVQDFWKDVISPCISVTFLSAVLPFAIVHLDMESLPKFLLNASVCCLMTLISSLYIGCTEGERKFIFRQLGKLRHKVLQNDICN